MTWCRDVRVSGCQGVRVSDDAMHVAVVRRCALVEQVFQKLCQLVFLHKVRHHKACRCAFAISPHAVDLPLRALAPHFDDAAKDVEPGVRGVGHGAYPSACCG